jgi:hypothetical protein
MLSWLRRERTERIEAEANALIRHLGAGAYSAARRREHEASSDLIARHWHWVALSVARQTGRYVVFGRSGSGRLTAAVKRPADFRATP